MDNVPPPVSLSFEPANQTGGPPLLQQGQVFPLDGSKVVNNDMNHLN